MHDYTHMEKIAPFIDIKLRLCDLSSLESLSLIVKKSFKIAMHTVNAIYD